MNSLSSPYQLRGNRGMALVIVLGLLLILFGLAMMFLARTNSERASAASFAALVSTSHLADAAVNLVQGQIRDATTQGSSIAWASQPGMIRNFNTGGAMTRAYKLYSAPGMVFTGNAEAFAEALTADLPTTDWAADRAIWTDLNAPVMAPRGDGSGNMARYPILDPRALGQVEGFSVTNAPAQEGGNPLPMPVRWLYVLQDGTMVAPEAAPTGARIPGATTSNPIVGRIAFWTDDETSKLNINTSSEGVYWDVPRVSTRQDVFFARFQPARNEFQRYPGHPGMTSLAPVLLATPGSGGIATTPRPITQAQRNAIYEVIPRIIGGGSEGGTQVPSGPIEPTTERLYASVDELVFDPERTLQLADAGIAPERLEFAPFFLTANSRAPEITLFNTPRVAMWPIDVTDDDEHRSAYDRLLAFCSTINGQPYYFTRNDPRSQTADFPGPPTFSPQTGLGRNRNLYAYLQALTERPIPGFGGTMLGKYGADRDQILTLMLDYIRITNVDDSTVRGVVSPGGHSPRFSLRGREGGDTIVAAGHLPVAAGFSQVAPIRIGETQGIGRFPVISEAGVAFICTADGAGFSRNGAPATLADCNNNAEIRDSNAAKLESNVAANRTLGGTLLQGEPFLDVGYGPERTGAGNGKFDWDDETPVAGFPAWQGNGVCDFEPWVDLNENGVWDPGEPFIDLNGNGVWDGEAHEPLHDWGRNNDFNVLDSDGSQGELTELGPTVTIGGQDYNVVGWDHPTGPFRIANGNFRIGNGRYEFAERRIEALFLIEPFMPTQGYPMVNVNFTLRVRGLDGFQVTSGGQTHSLNFPADGVSWWQTRPGNMVSTSLLRGDVSPRWGFYLRRLPARGAMPADGQLSGQSAVRDRNFYPFVSHPVTIPANNGTMEFSGGTVTLEIYPTSFPASTNSLPIPQGQQPVQTITLDFPSATIPIPELVASGTPATSGNQSQNRATAMQDWWTFSVDGCLPGTVQLWNNAPANEPTTRRRGRLGNVTLSVSAEGAFRGGSLFREQDVVRTLVLADHSDFRLLARPELGPEVYAPHPNYNNPNHRLAHSMVGFPGETFDSRFLAEVNGISSRPKVVFHHPNSRSHGDWDNGLSIYGDGAFINLPDGGNAMGLYHASQVVPYFNRGISGNNFTFVSWGTNYTNNPDGAQFAGSNYLMEPIFTLHSPNRQVPSAGMFGSLPTGIQAGEPFRTLLFRPQEGHFGASAPRDHLWADLFWMPMVEPYAISEPFSTGGKINMNYQILPFRYLTRQTALFGLLRNEMVLAIPNDRAGVYKAESVSNLDFRQFIDIRQTLQQFETVFAANRVFLSPTEICDLHLVPEGQTLAALADGTFWDNHRLTGDNSRERPYTNLLGRLTTKSNTFTVHYRVQALQKSPDTDPDVWNESRDRVVAEERGSRLIERYINPNDPEIPDYATSEGGGESLPDLGEFYKWRVVHSRLFAP